jgi:hypothetical protein
MISLVFFLILIGLGVAACLGRTADSRDPDYSLGLVLGHRARH